MENFLFSFSFINSEKKSFAKRYSNVAPIEAANNEIKIPHHLPKTKPANISIGPAKPKSKIHITEKMKKTVVRKTKFSFFFFGIRYLNHNRVPQKFSDNFFFSVIHFFQELL